MSFELLGSDYISGLSKYRYMTFEYKLKQKLYRQLINLPEVVGDLVRAEVKAIYF